MVNVPIITNYIVTFTSMIPLYIIIGVHINDNLITTPYKQEENRTV